MTDIKDKIRGGLIGGAAGDALGYPVEFYSESSIRQRYGAEGICSYRLDFESGMALISDDTQMSLFTASGVLRAETLNWANGTNNSPIASVAEAYHDWYCAQTYRKPKHKTSWLTELPEMHEHRAPGNTCMSALGSGKSGSVAAPLNMSKGCGGIMRVAPLGLFYDTTDGEHTLEWLDRQGAEVAALTHGHPLGYLPAAVLAHIVNVAAYGRGEGKASLNSGDEGKIAGNVGEDVKSNNGMDEMPKTTADRGNCENKSVGMMNQSNMKECPSAEGHSRNDTLKDIVLNAMRTVSDIFAGDQYLPYLQELVSKAILFSENDRSDSENIRELGEGWVAEETLAIAVYCSLRYEHDFSKALIASVNHNGDSDSTGAVTGNILGTWLGYEAIEEKWKRGLELKKTILELADDFVAAKSLADGLLCGKREEGSGILKEARYRRIGTEWEKKYLLI